MFWGIILAKICLKMHYFLIKSINSLSLEANVSAAGSFFLKIRSSLIYQVRTWTRRQLSDFFGL